MKLKKWMKTLFAVVLTLCMLIPQTVFAENETQLPQDTDLRIVQIDLDPAEYVQEAGSVVLYSSHAQESEWNKYATDYYYNKMDSRKQGLFQALDAVCYSYLTGTADVETKQVPSGEYSGMMSYVSYSSYGLSQNEAISVLLMFRFSNPQYYFINEYYWSGSGNIALGMYTDFTNGATRAAKTEAFKTKIDNWVSVIGSQSDALTKEAKAHELVLTNASYDSMAAYNQSCYSLLMNAGGATVCAGYAQTFALLCNAVGLDTICVTSNTHEWNQIKVNNTWYHVDATWNDNPGMETTFYNISTEQLLALDSGGDHTESSYWLGYLPDYEKAPTITPTYNNGNTVISITSAKNGGTIYYTLDGSSPTTASNVYSGPVTIEAAKTVKAITVYNGVASNMVAASIGVNNPTGGTTYKYGGVDYSNVFDATYYLNRYGDLKAAYGNDKNVAFWHFLNYGMNEGRQGISTFDVYSYRNQYADLRGAYGNNLKPYYLHYTQYGKAEGRQGTGCTTLQGAVTVYNGVNYAAVYDYNYYISQYPDINKAYGGNDVAVLAHFVNNGMSEGRQGNNSFNVYSYRNKYADLRGAYGNNLKSYYLHYVNNGKAEGRKGTGCNTLQGATTVYNGVNYAAVYDYNYYISQYPDINKAYGGNDVAVLAHFVNNGMNEGRQGNNSFNVYSYRNQYADLRGAYGNNLKSYYLHYVNNGKAEGRKGTGCNTLQGATTVYNGINYAAVYDYNYYISQHSDIKKAYEGNDVAVLAHFVNNGMSEGRQGSSEFNVYAYRNNNQDLKGAYGNNLKAYYMHYVNYGKAEGRSGK